MADRSMDSLTFTILKWFTGGFSVLQSNHSTALLYLIKIKNNLGGGGAVFFSLVSYAYFRLG